MKESERKNMKKGFKKITVWVVIKEERIFYLLFNDVQEGHIKNFVALSGALGKTVSYERKSVFIYTATRETSRYFLAANLQSEEILLTNQGVFNAMVELLKEKK